MTIFDQMTYTALVPYFGGKREQAAGIVEAIGPHRCYWSLFCGSLAVELCKEPCAMETVNDLHGDVVNLARCIRDEELSQWLHWKTRRTLPCQMLMRESYDILNKGKPPTIEQPADAMRAYHFLVNSWLGINGIVGTKRAASSFAVRYTSNGGSPAKRFAGMADSLPWWHERLRTITVLSECGIELAGKIEDKKGTVVYADPPYIVEGDAYLHGFTMECSAEAAFADGNGEKRGKWNDHVRLAIRLGRFKHTRVVVSYYAHPDLELLYPGWEVREIKAKKSLASGAKKPTELQAAPEVLLINRTENAS